jgi:Zn-dependent peptidase ImmA (M78 family)
MLTEVVSKFCSYWGTRDPEKAVLGAIQAAFPTLEKCSIPIDPSLLARERRITEINMVEMAQDGIIYAKGNEYVVDLNRSHSDSRKRFTLAHEIGHTFFFDVQEHPTSRFRIVDAQIQSIHSDQSEEHLCNVVASEILMPCEPFSNMMQEMTPEARTILTLAGKFKTSLQATARRVVSLSTYKEIVCLWRFNQTLCVYETEWVARKSTGASSLALASINSLFEEFRTAQSIRGRRWFSIGGNLDNYFIDAIPIDKKAERYLMVILLHPSAEFLMHQIGKGADQDSEITQESSQLSLFESE